MDLVDADYPTQLAAYIARSADQSQQNQVSVLRLEHHFECLRDWNLYHTIEEVREWFRNQRDASSMLVTDIPLNECRMWTLDPETGNVHHDSGEFFSVHGIRIDLDSREVGAGGWDQPILTQVGYDGGLLGILRQRFDGIPHYLIEAKAEPGNYERLQLSPTLQATFSNLKRAHEGSKPRFSEVFETPESIEAEVLYDQWMSEDGGRLHLKRNKGMLVQVKEGYVSELPEGFIWLSMWQIKELLHENAWVNPHIRGIIANL
jgi:oxidase EvaA